MAVLLTALRRRIDDMAASAANVSRHLRFPHALARLRWCGRDNLRASCGDAVQRQAMLGDGHGINKNMKWRKISRTIMATRGAETKQQRHLAKTAKTAATWNRRNDMARAYIKQCP